ARPRPTRCPAAHASRASRLPSLPSFAPRLSSGFGRLLAFGIFHGLFHRGFDPACLDARLHDDGVGVVAAEIETFQGARNAGPLLVLAGFVIADQIVGG